MKSILFFCLLGMLCSLSAKGQKDYFTLSGELEGLKAGDCLLWVRMDEKSGKIKRADTLLIKQDKNFRFSCPVEEEGEAHLIYFPGGRLEWKTPDDLWSKDWKGLYVIAGDHFLRGKVEQLPLAEVSGGVYTDRVKPYVKIKDSLAYRMKLENDKLRDAKELSAEQERNYYRMTTKIQDQQVKALLDFVKTVPESVYAAAEYYSMVEFFCDKMFKVAKSPYYQSPEQVERIYHSFPPEVKRSKYGMLIKKFIGRKALLAEGKRIPDFQWKDMEGKKLCRADLKGKYVLLEFWDSYCEPCLKCMPQVKNIYDRYKQKGLAVIGISSDEDVELCRKTIQKHRCDWRQVCCGQWEENKDIEEHFTIGGFPTFILIDARGKIVIIESSAIALREIEKYLEQHLHS